MKRRKNRLYQIGRKTTLGSARNRALNLRVKGKTAWVGKTARTGSKNYITVQKATKRPTNAVKIVKKKK